MRHLPLNRTRTGGIRLRFFAGLACLLLFPATVRPTEAPAVPNVSRQQRAMALSRDFGLSPDSVTATLEKARFRPGIIARMLRPYEAKPYTEYRPLFVNRKLVDMGKPYLAAHRKIFARAEAKYGVQPEIIAAILGMETRYGQFRGRDRILDALYTLSTGFPKRARFFRKELGHFLLMCREEGLRPERLRGSMAGAFGAAQFMPSSFREYAVDGDGDGRRDIWNSPADIIFSVANYFHRHGWDEARPVAYWLNHVPDRKVFNEAIRNRTRKWVRLGRIRKAGLGPLPALWRDDDRVSLLRFETETGERTALVHYNFYVIMRYNTARNYAMAATELAARLGCKKCATQ